MISTNFAQTFKELYLPQLNRQWSAKEQLQRLIDSRGNIRRINTFLNNLVELYNYKNGVSGTHQATGLLLTPEGHCVCANHTVSFGIDNLYAKANGRVILSADILETDSNNDIAIIKLDNQYLNPNWSLFFRNLTYNINPKDLADGEEIRVMGIDYLSGDAKPVIRKGFINEGRYKHEEFLENIVYASAQVQTGFSGAPVIDKDLNLVGIANKAMCEDDELHHGELIFTPIKYVFPMLEKIIGYS